VCILNELKWTIVTNTLLVVRVMKQVMGNSAVSKSRRHLDELSGTSLVSQRRYQSVLRQRSDAEESGISTSPSCNHSSSYSPTRDLLTAEPAVCVIVYYSSHTNLRRSYYEMARWWDRQWVNN